MISLRIFTFLTFLVGPATLALVGQARPATKKPTPTAGAPDVKSLSDLTGPWQLFVDDYLIESKSGLVRRYHAFQRHKANPLKATGSITSRGTILPGPDGKGYRKWVNANSMVTSEDGLAWTTRVQLKRNSKESWGSNISVIHTPWDKGREYKMIGVSHDPVQQAKKDPFHIGRGRYAAYSSDGIHWTEVKNNPLFPDRSDTGLFVWDPIQRRYFGTPKIWAFIRGFLRRCVGFAASDVFGSGWPTAEMLLVPDEEDDRWVTKPGQRTEFYSLSAFAYQSMYIGFLEVFRNTDGWKDGPIFIELITSRDGLHWQRPSDREPILPVGRAGAWDSGMIKIPNHPLVEGDQIKLYYRGGKQTHGFGRKEYPTYGLKDQHTTALGIATLRKDGFASLDAGAKLGTLTTKILQNPSGALAVNYKAKDGWLKVEVLDAAGKPLPGYGLDECIPLQGDSTIQTVAWKKRKELPRQPVRLRFQMQNASLYSFAAGPGLKVKSAEPELAVLFTFEGDSGQAATDRLQQDGGQAVYFHNAVLIDDNLAQAGKTEEAAFGKSEVIFLPPNSAHAQKLITETSYQGKGAIPWTYLEIDGTFRLGKQFTLAAFVKPKGKGKMRLFSSWEPYAIRVNEAPYLRKGEAGTKELLFDIDSGGTNFGCMRLVVHGQEIQAKGKFNDGKYHHLAATYDNGLVKLFLDGKEVGSGNVPGGAVSLLTNLHVGGDPGPMTNRSAGKASVDQLVGPVDDLSVLGRVLSTIQMAQLSKEGAAAFFDLAKDPGPTYPK